MEQLTVTMHQMMQQFQRPDWERSELDKADHREYTNIVLYLVARE